MSCGSTAGKEVEGLCHYLLLLFVKSNLLNQEALHFQKLFYLQKYFERIVSPHYKYLLNLLAVKMTDSPFLP